MKKVFMLLLSLGLLFAFVGCDSDDDDDDKTTAATSATSASSDVTDVQALVWTQSGDPHNLCPLYGGLSSFANLPVNFEVTSWSADGAHVSIPEGEPNLDPLGGDHMQKRRALILAFKDKHLIDTEDFAYTYNSHIGGSYGNADQVMAIHCKNGKAVSRTKLTNVPL